LALTGPVLVVHERIGTWARRLRTLLSERPVRLIETRSPADLERALAGVVCPLVLIDLDRRPRQGLYDLERAARVAPDALCLVIAPGPSEEVALLARQFGATHVMCAPVPPPAVVRLLSRWLGLAQRRAEGSGWAAPPPPPPEPWNWLTPLLGPDPHPQRPPQPGI
jgi:hypothetical protein